MKNPGGFFVVLVLYLVSCSTNSPIDVVIFQEGIRDEFPAEREFIEQFLAQPSVKDTLKLQVLSKTKTDETIQAQTEMSALVVGFKASWTQAYGTPLSKTWFVPREKPQAGRTGTTLADCLNGKETLVPLSSVQPPYTALLVDGLSVADEQYPLVRYVSISFLEAYENPKDQKRLERKTALLGARFLKTPKTLMEQPPSLVWICAAGDLMLGRGAGEILIEEGGGGIFGKTADYFNRSDLNMLNLEGAVSNRGEKYPKSFNFRFDPTFIPPLKEAGIHAALLANNHIFDYGETAFLDTLDNLEKNGIGILGAGRDITAAAAPFLYKKDDLEIRVFGIASFPAERTGFDGANFAAAENKAGMLYSTRGGAERLKKNFVKSDKVLNVVLFHGGHEWTWRPDPATRALYAELAQSGADLIIGSHPHTVQGFEWLEDKPVFWSLGNYVFAGMNGIEGGAEGLFIRLGYAGKTLAYLEPVPVQLKGPRSTVGDAAQLKRFYALSRELAK